MSNDYTKQAVVLQFDNSDHMIASSCLLGQLVKEYNTKDFLVCAYYRSWKETVGEGDKAKTLEKNNLDFVKKIITHFGISDKNVSYKDDAGFENLGSKLAYCAELCLKEKIHFINMPNTVQDYNNSPQEIHDLITIKGQSICDQAMSGHIEKQKPKDDEARIKLKNENRVSPLWKYQYVDLEYLKNNLSSYGLKELFAQPSAQ